MDDLFGAREEQHNWDWLGEAEQRQRNNDNDVYGTPVADCYNWPLPPAVNVYQYAPINDDHQPINNEHQLIAGYQYQTPIVSNTNDYRGVCERPPDVNETIGHGADPDGGDAQPTYRVRRELGRGEFGVVYEVESIAGFTNQRRAMKIEMNSQKTRLLKMELCVLKDIRKAHNTARRNHLCQLYDWGRTPSYKYIVMTLIGANLAELERSLPGGRFTLPTALKVAAQCLRCVEQLHDVGYVHRDLKPDNFSVGLGADSNRVYLFDFGHARRFIDASSGSLRRPRADGTCALRGTANYLPLSSHYQNEVSRGDDLESWFYLAIQFVVGSLPWLVFSNIDEILRSKEPMLPSKARLYGDGSPAAVALAADERRSLRRRLLAECPREFADVLAHIETLDYYTRPDYAAIRRCLEAAMRASGVRHPDEPLLMQPATTLLQRQPFAPRHNTSSEDAITTSTSQPTLYRVRFAPDANILPPTAQPSQYCSDRAASQAKLSSTWQRDGPADPSPASYYMS